VHLATSPALIVEDERDLGKIGRLEIKRGALELAAVHPMASIPMSDDPRQAAVDSRGKHHQIAGLWIADGSLFPSSIGVPPQVSIYGLGIHVGRAIASEAGR
jgi:choline dehydrogenase-like flavoprotein